MKLKAAVVCGAVVALAVPTAATAGPGTGSKVTGGGQSLADGKDTIGFNAKAVAGDNTGDGQVQYVDRASDGSSQSQYHGDVTCYTQVGDDAAVISGTWRHINGDPVEDNSGFFRLYVQDNGEPNQGRDFIFMNTSAPSDDCDPDDEDDDNQVALAHGNVQFHSAKGSKSKRSKKRSTKTAAPKVDLGTSLRLARL